MGRGSNTMGRGGGDISLVYFFQCVCGEYFFFR